MIGHRATPLHLDSAAASIDAPWLPRVATAINDLYVKVARLDGDFVWHSHPNTDEAFLCLSGEVTIELRDQPHPSVTLRPGDVFVVPRGVFHRPRTVGETRVALIEAPGTVNTGDAGGEMTTEVDVPLDHDD